MAVFASKWRVAEKSLLGLAQENHGRRSVRHAVFNGATAATVALLAWCLPNLAPIFTVAAGAALASATADTLASELDNVYGKNYREALSWRSGRRGDDGVISLEGTLLGATGAAIIAGLIWLGGATPMQLPLVLFGN